MAILKYLKLWKTKILCVISESNGGLCKKCRDCGGFCERMVHTKKKSVKKVLKVTSLVQHQLHTELI